PLVAVDAESVGRRRGEVDPTDRVLEAFGRRGEALAQQAEEVLRRGRGEPLRRASDRPGRPSVHEASQDAVDGRTRNLRANADLVTGCRALLNERGVRPRFVQAEAERHESGDDVRLRHGSVVPRTRKTVTTTGVVTS